MAALASARCFSWMALRSDLVGFFLGSPSACSGAPLSLALPPAGREGPAWLAAAASAGAAGFGGGDEPDAGAISQTFCARQLGSLQVKGALKSCEHDSDFRSTKSGCILSTIGIARWLRLGGEGRGILGVPIVLSSSLALSKCHAPGHPRQQHAS